ncbi:MAG TPA: glycosyltransferase [Thermoleophilaceae bacterium]|nr:glycosyltransferase [Thermoleophilaceae bacterium]
MSDPAPRLTVVIATLGRPGLLRTALATIARCDPPPAEVIVVDGDPARSAEPEAAAVGARYARARTGLTAQRNAGIELATGDVVVFVDDDTELDPGLFGALARAYADPEVVGATGHVIDRDLRRFGNMRSRWRRLLPGGGGEGSLTRYGYPRRLQDETRERDVEYMLGALMSARREVARQVRFDEMLTGYALLEDEDFSYRLSRVGRLRFVPDAILVHRNIDAGRKVSPARMREFNRMVVVNRAYLFRKNFRRTPLARLQFGILLAVLFVHRAVNGEWAGVRGLVDGSVEAWRRRA